MSAPDFTAAAELVERLRDSEDRALNGEDLCVEAADVVERMADWINHLTNVNDGLRETLDAQRKGLTDLRDTLPAVNALKEAAGQAITAISFELERAFERHDAAACLQLNESKSALIDALRGHP